MAHTLYELDVRLREIEPPIWRTVEVPGSWSLEDVHYALQVAMGWTNSHLHQFIIGKTSYGMADVDDSGDLEIEDEREFRLQDLVHSGESSFLYEYDFGDSWEHVVSVSKVTTVAKAPKARCIAGSRACPPEDCGGVGGYQHLLAVLANPRHEEHAEMVQWSQDFAPERFSLPKNGLDLGPEIKRLKALAEGDEPLDDDFDDEAAVGAVINLPRPLVDVVLALPPAERAALGAMITESLAAELVEVRRAAGQLVGSLARQHKKKPARGHGKRGRS